MAKRFVALILSMICILLFTGCSSEELSLMTALQKDAHMTSVKTTALLSGNMKITLPSEIQEEMDVNLQSILNMLSSFRLEADTEQMIQEDAAATKMQYSILSDDMNFSGELYTSIKDGQTKTIYKIPTLFKAMLPHQYENAVYYTIDTADIAQLAEREAELDRLSAEYYGEEFIETDYTYDYHINTSIADTLQLNDNLFGRLVGYAACMNDTPQLVAKSGNTFSLVITDKDFKALLRSAVLTYFDNPEAREEIANLWNAISTYYKTIYPAEIMEDFPALPQLPDDPDTVSQMRLQAEIIFALLENVRLVGEDGICVNYAVNSQGYITEVNADIHLDFDINAITELADGTADYEEDFAFEIRLHYNQKRENINRLRSISLPTLTEENNLPVYKCMAESLQDEIDWYAEKIENGETYEDEYEKLSDDGITLPAPDGSLSIVYDNGHSRRLLDFNTAAPILNENGTLYVPLEPLMDWFGAMYGWDEESQMIFFHDPLTEKWIYYYPGDQVMYSDDYAVTLSAPTMIKNGQDYLPLRAMISAFSDDAVSWNAEENAVYITPWFNPD